MADGGKVESDFNPPVDICCNHFGLKIFLNAEIKAELYHNVQTYLNKKLLNESATNPSLSKDKPPILTSVILEARDISCNDKKYAVEPILFMPAESCTPAYVEHGTTVISAIAKVIQDGLHEMMIGANFHESQFEVLEVEAVGYVCDKDSWNGMLCKTRQLLIRTKDGNLLPFSVMCSCDKQKSCAQGGDPEATPSSSSS